MVECEIFLSGPLPFFHVKRNETLTVNIEPIYFDGPLVVGLVHDHPDVQHNEIVNKNSSDEELDCKPDYFKSMIRNPYYINIYITI